MGRIKFGPKKGVEYSVPELQRYAHVSRSESLIFFDNWHDMTNHRMCYGIGKVTGIEKGHDVDIVKMCFGRSYSRWIYVKHVNARKQIFTLRKGQYAQFFGYVKMYREDGKIKAVFVASAFNGWLVPKAIDIKEDYDMDQIEEIKQEQEIDMLNFLDDILKGDEEDEDRKL